MLELSIRMMQDWAKDRETAIRWIASIVPAGMGEFASEQAKLSGAGELLSAPFAACGLWLCPSMTPSLVKRVIEKYAAGEKRGLAAIVEGFYGKNGHENLRRAVDDWSSYEFFSRRMHIFRDALDAHISGKWTLTIPALLPHVEGIAWEILVAEGLHLEKSTLVRHKGGNNYLSSLFGYLPASEVNPTKDVIIDSLLDYLEGTLYSYHDFKHRPETPLQFQLKRHAILHGHDTKYDTRINSLRCFLALDALSMLKGNVPSLVYDRSS